MEAPPNRLSELVRKIKEMEAVRPVLLPRWRQTLCRRKPAFVYSCSSWLPSFTPFGAGATTRYGAFNQENEQLVAKLHAMDRHLYRLQVEKRYVRTPNMLVIVHNINNGAWIAQSN